MNTIFSKGRLNVLLGSFEMLATAFVALFSATQVQAATCTYYPGHSSKTVSITIPAELSVPRDAPVGAIVWESSVYSLTSPANSYRCTATYKKGVKNMVGNLGTDKTDFLIGNTGLAWNLKWVGIGIQPDISQGGEQPAGGYGFNAVKWQIRIKKIGQVAAGASVPNGILGYYSINNEITPIAFSLSNEASVGSLGCKTPAVVVKMGDKNRIGDFKGVGTSLQAVNFSIGIKECPEGINKVSYLLKPNTEIVDSARSVVALDAASSAKGVGLQLLDENANPAALNKTIVFNDYDKVGGDFNIPLKVAYHQTAAVIEPGTANSSVTVVMTYQ